MADKKEISRYTINRSSQDLQTLRKLRKHLQLVFPNKSFRTDAELYRLLPEIYLNAVKRIADLDLQIDQLQSYKAQLELA